MSQKYQRRPTDIEAIKVCEENLPELQKLAKEHDFHIETRIILNFYDFDDNGEEYQVTNTICDGNYLILQSDKKVQSCTPAALEQDYVLIPAVTTAKYGIAPCEFSCATHEEAMMELHKQSQDSCWLGFYDNNASEPNKDHGYIYFVSISYLWLRTRKKVYYARNKQGGWNDITGWLRRHPDQVEPILLFP